MKALDRSRRACLPALLLLAAPAALAQEAATAQKAATASEAAITPADEVMPSEALLNEYMEHVDFLASPFLEGRLPGTQGMEIAKDYMQYFFDRAGLEPGYGREVTDRNPWRQPFPLAGQHSLEAIQLSVGAQAPLAIPDAAGNSGWGALGDARGSLVFAGYGVESAPEDAEALLDYQGFPEGTDLSGKVAMILRYEPVDQENHSAFGARRRSAASELKGKLEAVVERGAAAVLVVNKPSPRSTRMPRLVHRTTWSSGLVDVPVLLVSQETAQALIDGTGSKVALAELDAEANRQGIVRDLGGEVHVQVQGEYRSTIAENVIGVLPGRGKLANEVVIIGGHLDHLGKGGFGSRASNEERGKVVHPGADDNASGCAALILLAESLTQAYEGLPADQPARSIVFIAFSAEESGLNGAEHYTKEPVYPLEQTSLMINFDMIGRIENRRFSASGLSTGDGLQEFIESLSSRTPLIVNADPGVMAASDHWRFVQKKVPVVFASMANIHDDYHTPRDTSAMIQPLEAVWATEFVHEMAFEAALRAEAFTFVEPAMASRRSANGNQAKVVFGVNIGGEVEGGGVLFQSVSDDSSAGRAGVQGGDILKRWAGEDVKDVNSWRAQLAKMNPDDEVEFVVLRDGKELSLKAKMDGR